jgi:hypothetical protein
MSEPVVYTSKVKIERIKGSIDLTTELKMENV